MNDNSESKRTFNKKEEQIIGTAERLFMEAGISQTSMEKIASEVPVSKMTIYKYFQSKEILVAQVMERMIAHVYMDFRDMVDAAKDPLDVLIKIAQYEGFNFSEVLIHDLIHYYPEQIQTLMKFKTEMIDRDFEQIIFAGQQAGQFRKDISPHVMMLFSTGMKQFFSKPEVAAQFTNLHSIAEQILSIFCYGIVEPGYRKKQSKDIQDQPAN